MRTAIEVPPMVYFIGRSELMPQASSRRAWTGRKEALLACFA
jgi:hypothetical protein